ncbi:uncharacterized protein LOC119159978 [Rhipicephalus microplus]|uniref:uncharacterized protein LOC119159978 n=1 Tax=Rhipicephalus microplus TaxID=6941 RepID=UPI003F6D3475
MYKRGMSIELHSNHCDVYLCRAPLRNAVAGWPATLFASASRSAYGDSWEKHWLVIFDYGQDEVLLCDADQDHAGELTGRKSWKKRAVFKSTSESIKFRNGASTWPCDRCVTRAPTVC